MLNYGLGLVKHWTGKDKDKDLMHKDQGKDLNLVLKESLRTRTNITECGNRFEGRW